MKQPLPIANTHGLAANEVNLTQPLKTATQARGAAAAQGLKVVQADGNASFLESLQRLMQSVEARGDALAETTLAGKNLPLAANLADLGPADRLDAATDQQLEHGEISVSALQSGLADDLARLAGPASVPSALSDMPRKFPELALASLHPAMTDVAGQPAASLNSAGTVSARPPELPAPAVDQAVNTENALSRLLNSDTSLSRMLIGSTDQPKELTASNKRGTFKTDILPQAAKPEMAELQSSMKMNTLVSEADRLLQTRIQSDIGFLTSEHAFKKLAQQTLQTTPPTVPTDATTITTARSPMPQIILSSDSSSAPGQSSIMETLGRSDWGQGMGKQVMWMVNQNISRAEIRLHPANLGPLEVSIEMDNDQVNVAFSSRHADVRDAVEQALPRLREMLEDKGLNLSHADVSQHSFSDQRNSAFGQTGDQNSGSSSQFSVDAEAEKPVDVDVRASGHGADPQIFGRGLVDYYI